MTRKTLSEGRRGVRRGLMLCALLGVLAAAIGCQQDRIAQAGINGFTAVAEKLAEKADFRDVRARASARVVNPSYRFKGFVGTGFCFDGEITLNGVTLEGDLSGEGDGQGVPSTQSTANLHENLNTKPAGETYLNKVTDKIK